MERINSPVDKAYPKPWRRERESRTSIERTRYPEQSPKAIAYIQPRFEKRPIFVERQKQYSEADKAKFERLVAEWHDETDVYSSLLRVISHPAYLKVVAMGKSAIPLILQEMKRGPGHWFSAIEALTVDLIAQGEEPSKGCTSSSEARAAWVRWGESHGYL